MLLAKSFACAQTKRVVWYAIGANTLVMLGKFGACYATGSASLMSEGIHSLADVANQVCSQWA
jgi:divalent metal cation (Fe/Co/Zn/Cd) transporter